MKKAIIAAFASAALGYLAIDAQYSISKKMADDFESQLREVPENFISAHFAKQADLFKVQVTRDYTTADGYCYEQHKEQTHILGVSVNSMGYDRRCGLD